MRGESADNQKMLIGRKKMVMVGVREEYQLQFESEIAFELKWNL